VIKALLAEKLGMTQIFVDDRAIPVTVLRAGPCHVSQVKTQERDGYSAVQLAFGEIRPTLVTNPQAGHFAKAGVPAARHVTEIPVDDVASIEAGHAVTVGEVFAVGMKADVTGVTKGKGFSGVMKRHNFSGQRASHGVHRVHRKAGSIGAASTPARVFKGMPMAGRLGNDRRTILNLEVVALDLDENLIMLKGPVPGRTGSVVMLRHAVKKGDQGMPEPVVEEPEEAAEAAADAGELAAEADETAAETAADTPADTSGEETADG
jgi:large subunit ribosomal protein L3